jgi:hypothetical protein
MQQQNSNKTSLREESLLLVFPADMGVSAIPHKQNLQSLQLA